MRIPSDRSSARRSRGRALFVLALCLAGVLLGTGFWLGRSSDAGARAPAVAAPKRSHQGTEVPAPGVEAEAQERVTLPVADPDRGSPAEPLDAAPQPFAAADRPRALADEARDHAEQAREAEERMERLRRLRRGEDPKARLDLAREILAEDPDGPLVLHAMQTLAELDPAAAADEVRRRLETESEQPSGRGMMATVISMVGANESALSATDLSGFYERGDKDVQLAAARALQARGDGSLAARFRDECAAELSAEDPSVRAEAVRHLAATRQPDALPLILPLLSDADEGVRLQALRSVSQAGGDAEVLAALRALTQDPSERVRTTAERMVESAQRRLELRGR